MQPAEVSVEVIGCAAESLRFGPGYGVGSEEFVVLWDSSVSSLIIWTACLGTVAHGIIQHVG